MKLHYLQHVPFEDLANIAVWARSKGYEISRTAFFQNDKLPPLSELDWLVVMGGPMNIYEEEQYPWLAAEKSFIADAISHKKIVLGICLGAQLIADVLGGPVSKNNYKEIGWFPVSLTSEAKDSTPFHHLPQNFTAFHWHGDTFQIPPGAVRTAGSEGCANQAFVYADHVVGWQFHLESTAKSINLLIDHCSEEIVPGKYIQSPEEMRAQMENIRGINQLMELLLDNLVEVFAGKG